MSTVVVRYKVKPDQAEYNQELVEAVYRELHTNDPGGLRYTTFRLEDGVTFIHVAAIESNDGSNPLGKTAAFKAFQQDIADRCDEPPVAYTADQVGSYRFFGG